MIKCACFRLFCNWVVSVSSSKVNLLDFNRQSLRDFFVNQLDEKPFRAEQVMKWIYHFHCSDFSKMTNLSKSLISKLESKACIEAPQISKAQYSSDGTIKWAIKVDGNQDIETVYIPENDRATLCISSQVGCALDCKFCSTGKQGFNRNLRVSEIVGQIWRATTEIKDKIKTSRKPITNVVMMGMGEPLLNLNNLIPALEIMLDDLGYGLSKRRVTVSTSGVVPGLEQMIGKIDVALAISLHAPTDELRNSFMPINKKYNIDLFLSTVKRYIDSSNANRGKVTVEYILLDHINDGPEEAIDLINLLKDIPCKINLIPFNPHPGSDYDKPSNSRVDRFQKTLMKHGFTVTIRKIRGDDIDAACGQLAGDILDKTKRALKNKKQIQIKEL